jgi:hypothetical protein
VPQQPGRRRVGLQQAGEQPLQRHHRVLLEVPGEVPFERLEVDGRSARRQELVGQIAHPRHA